MPTPPQQCDGQQWQECKPTAAADRVALARRAFSIEVRPAGVHRISIDEARIVRSGVRGTRIGHTRVGVPSVDGARVGRTARIDAAVDAHLTSVGSEARVENDASVKGNASVWRARVSRADDDPRIQERAAALTRHVPAATGGRCSAVAAREVESTVSATARGTAQQAARPADGLAPTVDGGGLTLEDGVGPELEVAFPCATALHASARVEHATATVGGGARDIRLGPQRELTSAGGFAVHGDASIAREHAAIRRRTRKRTLVCAGAA